MYKGKVEAPLVGMIDNIANTDMCSNKTVMSNITINAFREAKSYHGLIKVQ